MFNLFVVFISVNSCYIFVHDLVPLEPARQLCSFLEHKDVMDVKLSDYCYALLQIRCAQEVLIIYDFKETKLFTLFLHRKKYQEGGIK